VGFSKEISAKKTTLRLQLITHVIAFAISQMRRNLHERLDEPHLVKPLGKKAQTVSIVTGFTGPETFL